MDAVFAPITQQELRIINYLEAWLVCVVSEEQCHHHVALLLEHIQNLGLHRLGSCPRKLWGQWMLGWQLVNEHLNEIPTTQRCTVYEYCIVPNTHQCIVEQHR